MLVNEGTFTRNIVGNNNVYGLQNVVSGDFRIPATFDIYLNTNIDFLDVHIYYANTSGNTVLNSFADDLSGMNFWSDEVQELLKKKPLFMGEFGPNARIFPTEESANEVWLETVRLATESGFKGFAVWTLESHNQTECWNILANDGKFDLFIELVCIHTGMELPDDGNDDVVDDGNQGETPSTSDSSQGSTSDSSQDSMQSSNSGAGEAPTSGGCGGSVACAGMIALLAVCSLAVIKKREN